MWQVAQKRTLHKFLACLSDSVYGMAERTPDMTKERLSLSGAAVMI